MSCNFTTADGLPKISSATTNPSLRGARTWTVGHRSKPSFSMPRIKQSQCFGCVPQWSLKQFLAILLAITNVTHYHRIQSLYNTIFNVSYTIMHHLPLIHSPPLNATYTTCTVTSSSALSLLHTANRDIMRYPFTSNMIYTQLHTCIWLNYTAFYWSITWNMSDIGVVVWTIHAIYILGLMRIPSDVFANYIYLISGLGISTGLFWSVLMLIT